jgi:hypothetical protein
LNPGVALPEGLEEASGIAVSRAHPGAFWTHEDGEEGVLYAVDADGSLLGAIGLGSSGVTDWEDLAIAACDEGDCLYLSDTGDNDESRSAIRFFRVPEPDPGDSVVGDLRSFGVRLPNGPRDIEAIFVLPGERVYFVSKGRNHPITVYRYPGTFKADSVVTLDEVQQLSEGPRFTTRQVTGASASPDGDLVAIRTYETVTFYRMTADTLASVDGGTLNLRTLREPQGEGVGLGPDGVVALASEVGPTGRRGSLALARCDF